MTRYELSVWVWIMTLSEFKIIGKRILIKVLPCDESRGGILLPAQARRNQDYAEIVQIGPEAEVDFKVGDRCMVNRYPMPDEHMDLVLPGHKMIYAVEVMMVLG